MSVTGKEPPLRPPWLVKHWAFQSHLQKMISKWACLPVCLATPSQIVRRGWRVKMDAATFHVKTIAYVTLMWIVNLEPIALVGFAFYRMSVMDESQLILARLWGQVAVALGVFVFLRAASRMPIVLSLGALAGPAVIAKMLAASMINMRFPMNLRTAGAGPG